MTDPSLPGSTVTELLAELVVGTHKCWEGCLCHGLRELPAIAEAIRKMGENPFTH